MLARNRELARAVGIWLALTAGSAAAALAWGRPLLAGGIALGSILAALPFLALTSWRYRALRRLAGRLDRVLAGEREISFAQMEEGEFAVLASELDKMVARLTLTAEELAHERQALADALADISHQLKTPLTSLTITTELVRKELSRRGDAPGLVERLRRIETLETRVTELVSVLLRLARLDAGAVRFARAEVAVDELVDRAAAPLAIAYDLRDVTLVRKIEPGCRYTGDLAWTAEALGNVLKNCLEHTPAGGTVTVRAAEDLIACRIVVEDTGPGIAEEDLPHIFERFYRGEHGVGGAGAVGGAAGAGATADTSDGAIGNPNAGAVGASGGAAGGHRTGTTGAGDNGTGEHDAGTAAVGDGAAGDHSAGGGAAGGHGGTVYRATCDGGAAGTGTDHPPRGNGDPDDTAHDTSGHPLSGTPVGSTTDAADRFSDGAAGSEVDPAGVGIGLSLAQALVAGQNGSLTAENARDAAGRVTGARFTLTFFKDIAV